ncbi:MAG: AraC family transcriptional regulator, partial [Eubacteriales bacterium]|nr:AraC family transcriptional regulator [Eubacteriales bacterium]
MSIYMRNTAVFDDSYSEFFVEYRGPSCDAPQMQAKHYHNLYEIYYFLGNNMKYNVGDKNLTLNKNDVLLINKFVFHKSDYNLSKDNERILIIFNCDLFSSVANKAVIGKILKLFRYMEKIEVSDPEQKECINSLFMNLVTNYNSSSQYGQYISQLNLIEICLRLIDICKLDINYPDGEVEKESRNTVADVIKYITTNYNTEITLDSLAEHFYVNKYHLCHLFKYETGLSIIDFINRKRLFEAEKLLRRTDNNVTEICYKVGFSSINHFIKLFK